MSNAWFIAHNDFDDAVLVESPAMEATMPITNAQLDARDRVGRSTSIGTQVVQGHWDGNERKPDGLIIKSNGWGGKIRLQIHRNLNYTSDSYDSGTLDLGGPLPTLENFEWGEAPLGLTMADLLAKEACYSLSWTAAKGASFTLTFSQCQDLCWQFDRILFGRRYELPWNPEHGMTFGPPINGQHTRTRGGSVRSTPVARWNELQAELRYMNNAERAAWLDFVSRIANGTVGVSLRPGAGGREERDHVDIMVLQSAAPNGWANPALHATSFHFLGI